MVLQYTIDKIVGDTIGVIYIVSEMGKGFFLPVEIIKAAAPGAYPQISFGVFNNAFNVIVTQAGEVACIVFLNGELVAVEFIQTVLCAEPHKTAAIL